MTTKKTRVEWSRILAVLFAIVLPLSTMSLWAVATVADTNQWVSTMHPLATNPVITNYVAVQGAHVIVTELKIEDRIKNVLPPAADFIAGAVTTQIEVQVAKALSIALATKQFVYVWDKANRLVHASAVDLLNGSQNNNAKKARSVVLNITPSILAAIDKLDQQGYTFLDPLKQRIKSDKLLVLKLLNLKQIQRYQTFYRWAVDLEWILPIITLALALGVVFTSRPRRGGLRRLAIALTASSVVMFALLRIGIQIAGSLAPTPESVSHEILATLTRALSEEFLVLSILGIAALAFLWFMGDSERAGALRQWLGNGAHTVGAAVGQKSKKIANADRHAWIDEHRGQLKTSLAVANVAVGTLAVIALLWWVGSVLALVIVIAVAAVWYWLADRIKRQLNDDGGPAAIEQESEHQEALKP